jgi:cell division protein FtsB
MTKFLSLFVLIAVLSLIVFGLGKQIFFALQAGKRLDDAAEQVNNLQQQNRVLKDQLTQAQKYDFIEEQARDKLNLVKPGETVVVVPSQLVDRVLAAEKHVEEVKLPNWQGWLKLFTH